ncbi:hypothetical protein R1sor_022788 [Riccia sorocarpa]|uniref:Uncharacterized protein n=1 Tax=Riccia sorocarpa TaxID=122646 RepID=A0ABD3GKU9_9MARC
MKPAKTRQATALPKALLIDPDALLLHIDRAVMATEYARATHDLSNMPPGPSVFNTPAKTSQTASRDADDPGKKAGGFLHGSLVEDFLQKVTSSDTDPRRSRRNKKHTASVPELLSLPQKPRSSVAKYHSASSGLSMLKGSAANADSKLDSAFPPQGSSSQFLNASPVPVKRFNPLTQDMQLERPLAGGKLSFFHPARSSLRAKAFSLPSNDSGSEYEFHDGEKTSSASSTCTVSPVEKLRQGSPRVFSQLDLSSLLGKSDSEDKHDSTSEAPTQYDAIAADQAYRAGSAAMEDGDMLQAIALLRLASMKCPRNRPSALVKIEKLITGAAQQLEMQEASRNNDDTVDVVEQEPNSKEVERRMPMKVLAVGDMLKADEAYRAGVAALEAGEPEKALEHLETALFAYKPAFDVERKTIGNKF